MATNPLYNANNSPNNATQPTKSVNNQGVAVKRTHNTFDNSYFHFKTQKFGQYEPFFVCEGVPKDTITLHSSHNVRALPMSSPFLSSLTLNKDYFMIPNQAIQPNTWEYIYKQPSQGDDVPFDAQNLFPLYANDERSFFDKLADTILRTFDNVYEQDSMDNWRRLIYSLLNAELFFSAGSLLSNLGFKLSPVFREVGNLQTPLSFDSLFDLVFSNLYLDIRLETDYVNAFLTNNPDEQVDGPDRYLVDTYTLVSIMRRYGSKAYISGCRLIDASYKPTFTVENLPQFNVMPEDDDLNYLRMDRINAYHLACSQYYVNPQVDFIYNAQLYRDNFFSLLNNVSESLEGGNTVNMHRFFMNGISVPYDYFSLRYYRILLSLYDADSTNALMYDILSYLFGFRESLRFGDYFTDSRTRPLAPGTNGVPVIGNEVSVIDMSRSIIYQRFRNAVVKLSNNFEDYLRGIMGTSPSPDYHFPKFISHNDFVIAGKEVANTSSDNQGDLVTNLQTADDTYAFEVTVDMPCVILGLSYFSIPRVYSQTKDRFFFHKDRFDFFNPILQYDIDQKVYNIERTDKRPNDEVFGYQSRYNEYKQKYSIASGGFVTSLPSWTFVTDSLFAPVVDIAVSDTQSPEFIRACDFEFNRFLSRINGVSMSNGFHFIVVYNNKSPQVRPMEVNPNVL